MLCAVEDCAVQNKGITLTNIFVEFREEITNKLKDKLTSDASIEKKMVAVAVLEVTSANVVIITQTIMTIA